MSDDAPATRAIARPPARGADGDAAPVARVVRVAGALVEARPLGDTFLYELARVGVRGLLAEVIRLDGDVATLQVYEDTQGLQLGEPVVASGRALTAQLGPGLLGGIVDGIGRPLARLADATGDFLLPGADAPTLDPEIRWAFTPSRAPGEAVRGGDVLGTVREREGIEHRVLVPPDVAGTLARLDGGDFTVDDPIGALDDGTPLRLAQRWPVRVPRPVARRLPAERPFVTGQRVFDFCFPVAEGGTAAVPGGFGTGKTVVEHALAKFADADVVVFVGCGERGNEMTDVLDEFPRLVDPRTGRAVMDRAVLVVNTSNMPVAAREASIYLGVTIAEYYRDMGLRVALMVDSASRWAEALREIGARLQEMPGEEGYPTYLASRLGRFFERAGRMEPLGAPRREGAVTIIGAISPPGGDFSEPVTQAALRVCGALWALDPALAHQRHYPAVDWDASWSLYADLAGDWFARDVGADWPALRTELLALLQRERELRDVAALVGPDALEDPDRLVLEVAAVVREVLLRQNAFHPHDGRSSAHKTHALAVACRTLHEAARAAVAAGTSLRTLPLGPARVALAALRDAPEEELPARAAAAGAAIEALRPRDAAPAAASACEPPPAASDGAGPRMRTPEEARQPSTVA